MNLNQDEPIEVQILRDRKDVPLHKFEGKRVEDIYLVFNSQTFELVCSHPTALGRTEHFIPIGEIKEIRRGKVTPAFKANEKASKRIDDDFCFVIFYGQDFCLKSLSLAAPTCDEARIFVDCIRYLSRIKGISYRARINGWMQKCFNTYAVDAQLKLEQLKQLTKRINYNIPLEDLRERFVQHSIERGMSLEGFQQLVRSFLHNQQIFTDCFGTFGISSNLNQTSTCQTRLTLSAFQSFIQETQKEIYLGLSSYDFVDIKRDESSGESYISVTEACDYLFSKKNQLWDDSQAIMDDMTKPLSHYWISTSHNTYLTGDQINSESSVEAYVRVLRQGCRCIELDCWNGPGNRPIIYHGRTLTTKICFLEVLKAIKEHAFVTSEYPIIISIENHCSIKQQRVMARDFHDVFGRMLVTEPLNPNETTLPSPESLKRRIILKGKKMAISLSNNNNLHLSREENEGNENQTNCQHPENDDKDPLIQGRMYLQNPQNDWVPYYFSLQKKKLGYQEIKEGNSRISNITTSSSTGGHHCHEDELHMDQVWYHGRVEGSPKVAEERVRNHNVEGAFLVRDSDGIPGSYVIVFLSGGKAHNIRIRSMNLNGQNFYFILRHETFDSLFSLVAHYQSHPLETNDFTLHKLTEAVPVPEIYLQKEWFHPNLDHKGAEEILRKIPQNGIFLVRYSRPNKSTNTKFSISFKVDNMVKHCRIISQGRLLLVSNQKFENIVQLVEFYNTHPFYKGSYLLYAVDTEWINKVLSAPECEGPSKIFSDGQYTYCDNNDIIPSISVRAVQAYTSDLPENLSFSKGDIIENVVKDDDLWWKGDLGDHIQKSFPSHLVEEMEPETNANSSGSNLVGSVELGRVEIGPNSDSRYPFLLNIYGSASPFRVAVTSEREAKEWRDAINKSVGQRDVITRHGSEFKRRMNKWVSSVFGPKEENKRKIAKEFSRLIVYCITVPRRSKEQVVKLRRENPGKIYKEMTSLSESKARQEVGDDPRFYCYYHQLQLSRAYPNGKRIDSSNYNPVPLWNAGCQMVALNFQTPDMAMQLNHGKFRANGSCGYVRRPEFMFANDFDPNEKSLLARLGIKSMTLHISVVAARHLISKSNANRIVTHPCVEIEIVGADFDCAKQRTREIGIGNDNGLSPVWSDKFTFVVLNPDLALIRFSVHNQDYFGDSNLLAQATYPVIICGSPKEYQPFDVTCLRGREGYRSVPLTNGFGEELMSVLLVHLQIS